MKRIYILMGMVALTFASCTRDQVKEANNGHAIDFRVATQTKATETTTANLSTFYVTALDADGENYFTDAAFTKIENYYSSSPAYYWPGDGSTLSFYAYAPSASDLGATVSITGNAKKITGFTPKSTIADQMDLIVSQATGSKSDESSGVELTFSHILSQIEIKARNANEGYVYNIKGIRIAQAKAVGEYDFETSGWTIETDAQKATYEVTYSTPVTLDTYAKNIMATAGDNAMLIPQQLIAWTPETDKTNQNAGAYISVYANIETKEGAPVYPSTDGGYDWIAVPADTEWEPGYKYVYTLDFTNGAGYTDPTGPNPGEEILGSPIKFTVAAVEPWGEKATMEATKSMMIGNWAAQRMESLYTYNDGSTELDIYDTLEETRDYLNERFWYIKIISETEYVVYAGTEDEHTCGYEIIDNHLYIEEFKDEEGNYKSDMFIRDINEDIATFIEIFHNDTYTRENTYYYIRQK